MTGDDLIAIMQRPTRTDEQHVCAECGRPAIGMFGDAWFCKECGDITFKNWHKPSPTIKHRQARTWAEWRQLEHPEPGNEPDQRDVPISPIPAYNYPSVPGGRPTPGAPLPVQRVRDPECETGNDFTHFVKSPEQPREYVPVSHSSAPARTRPFLPSRRDPEPVLYEPVSTVHEAQIEQPVSPPYSSRPSAETQKPKAHVSKPSPTNVSPMSAPNLPHRAQSDNLADNLVATEPTQKQTQKTRPHVTTPLPERFKFVGRGVGRERTFFEVIELLTLTQKRGDFPDGTTDRMRTYYRRIYPEYFSRSKRAAGKRDANQRKADEIRAKHRPRRRKVKPVLHTA